MARHSREITAQSEIDYLVNLDEEDLTLSAFMNLFGEFNGKAKYHPYDTFTIPVGKYGYPNKNKNKVHTTIGIFIWNKMFIEHYLPDTYINEEIDSDRWDDLIDDISRKVLEDELPLNTIDHVLLSAQKVMPMCSVLSPTITDKFLKGPVHYEAKKKELAKKYKDGIEAGDPAVASKMEKEMMDYAKEYLKDDPSMDLYNSGARSSFKNHFKNMYLMKGAIANPDPNAEKQFNIALSCYNSGISKDEYALFCNSLAAGPYHRAKKTADGGYWEKLFLSAFQHLKLGPKDSDCGTKDTITVHLTKKNVSNWMYSYIVDGSNLVELTSKNMNKYLDRDVKFRFASLCEYKDRACFCNKCVGNLYYRLDIQNIGVAVKDVASVIKNKNMKAFHDSTVSLAKMDVKKAFGE